ncbi:immunity protein Imm33 domain-containing protein [Flavivirga eckloniae]|uniref:Imm33-like domain-containing protein n=1 Tax=Flavivirga eckloniae TaxID=1803846 RepID=A0A2K9PVL5_9FLAO|nr:hypothetical protein [Flavivirga eckloniae]AUP81101.1 hypothetical protein C1H87_21240 [Flavivirga eckloniae]
MAFNLFSKKQEKGKVFTTKKCKEFNHPEIQFTISDKSIPDVDIDFFISTLEIQVSNGVKYNNGESIQIGSVVLEFKETGNVLELIEPDFKSFPIEYVNTLDFTLLNMRLQKDIVESIDPPADLLFPSIMQSIVVCENYKTIPNVLMIRYEPENRSSGWWFFDYDDKASWNDPDNFAPISIYEFALHRPDLFKFLAFPEDFQVLYFSGKNISILNDEEVVDIKENSFLSALNESLDNK